MCQMYQKRLNGFCTIFLLGEGGGGGGGGGGRGAWISNQIFKKGGISKFSDRIRIFRGRLLEKRGYFFQQGGGTAVFT